MACEKIEFSFTLGSGEASAALIDVRHRYHLQDGPTPTFSIGRPLLQNDTKGRIDNGRRPHAVETLIRFAVETTSSEMELPSTMGSLPSSLEPWEKVVREQRSPTRQE